MRECRKRWDHMNKEKAASLGNPDNWTKMSCDDTTAVIAYLTFSKDSKKILKNQRMKKG